MENNGNVYSISLGAEELALALSMINQPDMARKVMYSISSKMSNEQMDARLTSASHSLAAHNLTEITAKGTVSLEPRLEKALLPLVKFDNIIQIAKSEHNQNSFFSIHIYQKRFFTSHSIKQGVIHLLESGDYDKIENYILDKYQGFEKEEEIQVEDDHKLSLGLLGKLIKDYKNEEEIFRTLLEVGVLRKTASRLSFDIIKQSMRGSIMMQSVDASVKLKKGKYKGGALILLLAGEKENWLFEFAKADDNEIAVIKLAGIRTLSASLRDIILTT